MPTIAELQERRRAAIAAHATPPAAPRSESELAGLRAELQSSLASIDALLAFRSPATQAAASQIPAALRGLQGEALWKAQWASDAKVRDQFMSEAGYLAWMARLESPAGRNEPMLRNSNTTRTDRAQALANELGADGGDEATWRAEFKASKALQDEFMSEGGYVGFRANQAKIMRDAR